MQPTETYTTLIKAKARDLGFDFCGIATAEFLADEAPRLERWLNQNQHGQMGYMANHFDERLDPRRLVEDAKSVVTVLLNYMPAEALPEGSNDLKISKYAYGEDYHFVIKDKLKSLLEYIRAEIGEVGGSGHGQGLGQTRRAGLGRQTFQSDKPADGQFFFHRRTDPRPGPHARPSHRRLLRHLHPLHRCLPHASHHRPLCGGR
jgi:hypothetical protein